MGDGRRLGHAQRRRMGAPSNVYGDTMKPPSHDVGDTVKAQGRYRLQTVTSVRPGVRRPNGEDDGHDYTVTGGKRGRSTTHSSSELTSFGIGQEEAP